MKPLRRVSSRPDSAAAADGSRDAGGPVEVATDQVGAGKGRPTPKRRDTQPHRGPVNAPKTSKEARQRQKQLASQGRQSVNAPKLTQAEYRAALRRGDPSVLPRKDQGPMRALTRDYVDSHRMLANYLLLIFPLLVLSTIFKFLDIVVIALLVVIVGEGWFALRRIQALAVNRGLKGAGQGGLSLGFYAVSRAYLPRRWRLPAPQVSYGDEI